MSFPTSFLGTFLIYTKNVGGNKYSSSTCTPTPSLRVIKEWKTSAFGCVSYLAKILPPPLLSLPSITQSLPILISKSRNKVANILITSGFATTHVVVFLWVCIAGGAWGEEDI